METFKVIKCQSCGSTVVEMEGESIAKCSHCGSQLFITRNKFSKLVLINSILLVSLVLFAIGVSFWLLSDDSVLKQELTHQQGAAKPQELITKSINSIPKLNTSKLVISNEQLKEFQDNIEKPKMSIVNKVAGRISTGGIYWIVTIRNDSEQIVSRPTAIMSLFDANNLRLEEQKGWSKLAHLKPGQETELLIHIAKPPLVEYRSELVASAKKLTNHERYQEKIDIENFIVKTAAFSKIFYEIIGDVYNPHDYQVDFIKVIAVARDKDGVAIGLADVFVTDTNLKAHNKSGFKISAGAFITSMPDSWTLFAIGRKH